MAVNNFYDSLNMETLESTETFIKLERRLRDNRWCKPILDQAEVSLNINRVYLVLGSLLVFFIGLLLQYGGSMITNALGFFYPLYKTILDLEKPNPPVEKKWLIYWLIHAALNFVESTFFFFLYWLPGYWMLKCGFLYWCYAPQERNGSDIVYDYMIQPLLHRNQVVEGIQRSTPHTIYTDADMDKE